MKIYVRKILSHDITHEVSVTTSIYKEFFEELNCFQMIGKRSNIKGVVSFNNATDLRFGGDFKNIIRAEGDVVENDIILVYKYANKYLLEIVNQNDSRFTLLSDITSEDVRHSVILTDDEDEEEVIDNDEKVIGAFNKIYYGVPGCGKSYTVDKEFNKEKFHIERTTFHPEFTNSDFVGQIIPVLKENAVSYEFHVGAFTKALEFAINNPSKKVCLVVEEINRGNASSIFGDIFQLLDRDSNGASKYSIFNGPVIDYLKTKGINISEIAIPSNMWIIATMNTNDQNVFTLDTAFKRRWKMEYIKNEFSQDQESTELKNSLVPTSKKGNYSQITWGNFVNKINKHILDDKSGINGEDKQLGMYFVNKSEVLSEKEFAEKILSYLWEDVAKLNPEYWFGDVDSYDKLLKKYEDSYLEVFDSLFEEEIIITEETTANVINRPEGE